MCLYLIRLVLDILRFVGIFWNWVVSGWFLRDKLIEIKVFIVVFLFLNVVFIVKWIVFVIFLE